MVIVSIVKQVPAPEARLRLSEGLPDLDGVTLMLDGMDEHGVEEALRIRDGASGRGADVELVALGYGPEGSEHVVHTALAMGFDRGVHLTMDASDDPLSVAPFLANVIREVGARLVFVGGKHADWDSSALGPAVAEALDWPHVDWVNAFRVEGAHFEAVHDIDQGSERVRGALPVLLTAQQTLNEPRYPTLPNIMKARSKPLDVRRAEAAASTLVVRAHLLLEQNRRRVVLDGDSEVAAQELVRRLREEANVL